jgi:hypothetical protein
VSTLAPRVGVPVVSLGYPDTTTILPPLTGLVFTASGITATNVVNNDVRQPLSQATTYQVMIGLLGYDVTNGGFAVTPTSPGSGVIQLTGTQNSIWIQVPNGNWPANYNEAIVAMVFIKSGTGNWQSCDFAYVDQNKQSNFFISAQPLSSAPFFTTSVLQSYGVDPAAVFTTRVAYGNTYTQLGPTTGGVTFDRGVSTVTISPDNGPDYQAVTTRGCNLTFQTLPNAMIDFVRATSGVFTQAPGDGTSTIRVSQQTLLTAQALLKGNRALQVAMPADSTGVGETRIYVGNLTISQTAVTTSFTKTAQAPIQYNLQTAAQDSLILNMSSEVSYQRFGG